MKKLIALLLAAVMLFALVACTSSAPATETPAVTETPAAAETPATETPATETPATTDTEGAVKTDEISADADAAALGIPAAVVLQDTDVLKGKKLGCSICYKGDEWCAALAQALEALGKYYGADLVCEDGDLNDETQTKQIENMIANGCDAIMVDPITPDGSTTALNKAVDAGIPIIIYDGYWTEGAEKAVTTVTNYVKEHNDGKARVVELTNAVSTHCQERFVGLHEVIDAANADGCQIEILNKYDSQGNRETAYNAISAIVEPYDYVISDVDNGAMGAVSALQATGNTTVKVLSMGAYGQEPFGMLHNNDVNYLACLNVDAWVLAKFIFDGTIAYFEGKEVPTQTNIDLFVVDNSNVEKFWSF